MVLCHRCGQRPAEIPYNKIIEGRPVYMALCKECYAQVTQETDETASKLDKFGRDLTELAKKDKLDPVIGRKDEIERLVHILSRRTKNNPVLIGEPGVGKTAIVEGLAQKIIDGNVPEPLRGKRVFELDLASILAGTSHRGMFESRLKDIIKEVVSAQGQIILFLDELHTIIGAGTAEGAMDAANILKPALARGELQMVGATTIDEYRKYIERDAALERRFQPIMVNEPTPEDTVKIIQGLRERYEKHHQVKISDEAIQTAVKMGSRYINDRFLPDKAIDLIDESASLVRISQIKEPRNLKDVQEKLLELKESLRKDGITNEEKNEIQANIVETTKVRDELVEIWTKTKLEDIPVVKEDDVIKIVSRATGIPLEKLSVKEKEKLMNLENMLHERIVGQDEAVRVLSHAIRRARSGMQDPKRPIGTFLFLGPTGVGKTELSKALAEVLYGDEDMIVRIDMSEYMEKHSVSKLIGAPPGYIGFERGGQLTEVVRRKPFSVILLDEIEKAHPDTFNALLQIMEDGRLTDSQGRTVNFKNTILIMTSNVGSELLRRKEIGFSKSEHTQEEGKHEFERRIDGILKETFKPEFLNRIDEIIYFSSLSKEEIKEIVKKLIEKVADRLKESKVVLKFDKKVVDYFVEKGFDPEFGARPLRRLIQKEMENMLSAKLLSDELPEGIEVEILVNKGNLAIKVPEKANITV